MPLNLLKVYPQLLDLAYMTVEQRTTSLRAIFKRDIEDNAGLNFRTKLIRPVKGEEPSMQILFKHLTCEENRRKMKMAQYIQKEYLKLTGQHDCIGCDTISMKRKKTRLKFLVLKKEISEKERM